MKRTLQVAALLVVSTLFPASLSASNVEQVQGSALDKCLATTRKLQALFLVDESVSLRDQPPKNNRQRPGNDPDDTRVPALKAAIRALTSLTRGSEDVAVKVEASLAGFGDRFIERAGWMDLNDTSISTLEREIEKQADRDTDQHTRYHRALDGALRTFVKSGNGEAACRLLVWFSDGLHDDDDAGNVTDLSSRERQQIQKDICGSNGILSQLHNNGVYVRAVGLNESMKQMELMKAIAEGNGSVALGAGSTLKNCGFKVGRDAGEFSLATDADDIVDQLISVPGGPEDDVATSKCADGSTDCSEIRFKADGSILGFKMLITRPSEAVTVELASEQCGKVQIFLRQANSCADTTTIETLTDSKALLDVRRNTGSIEGEWSVSFRGPEARLARGRVRFVGEADISVTDKQGQELRVLDRYKAGDVVVTGKSKERGLSVQDVAVTLEHRDVLSELKRDREPSTGNFVVPGALVQSVLKGVLSEAPSVEMVLQPAGVVEGLRRIDGGQSPVEVDYKPLRIPLSVTDGQLFPEFIPSNASEVMPRINGTAKTTLTLRFRGPDSEDGKVKFEIAEANELGFSLISGEECEVPKGVEVTCVVEVKPNKQSYGVKEVPLVVERSTSQRGNAEGEQVVSAKVEMTRKPNVEKGVWTAVALVVAFLLIQGALRLFFATQMSRFPAVSATTRKARISVVVGADGSIAGTPNQIFAVQAGDDGFAFENLEHQQEFDLYGYHYEVSTFSTFFRSTSSPVGRVSRPGHVVIGSLGTHSQRNVLKDNGETTGLVPLNLVGTWIVGMTTENFVRLTEGVSVVEADLVVYLKPYEVYPRQEQLQQIEFEFGTTVFASDLNRLISEFVQYSDKPQSDPTSSDTEEVPQDPWGEFGLTGSATRGDGNQQENTTRKKRRKFRNDSNSSSNDGDYGPSAEPLSEYDPFA